MDGFFKKAAAQVSKDVYAYSNGTPELRSFILLHQNIGNCTVLPFRAANFGLAGCANPMI